MGKFSKSNFNSEVKQILDQVSTNQQQIVTATSTASTANAAANEAKTAAQTATTTANTAKSTADTANTNASAAKTSAQTATTTANEAKTAAQTATTVANEAKTAAQNATTIANEAKQLGNSVKQNMVSSLLSVDSSLPITNDSSWDVIAAQTKNIQSGIDIDGLIQDYKVYAGQNVSAGDFVKYIEGMAGGTPKVSGTYYVGASTATTSYGVQAVLVSERKVLLVYTEQDTRYGTALLLTFPHPNTGLGESKTKVVFHTASTYVPRVCMVGTDKAIIAYGSETATNAIGVNISGNTLSFTSSLQVFSKSMGRGELCSFEDGSGKALLALNVTSVEDYYGDNQCIVLTHSGSSISKGTALSMHTKPISSMNCIRVASNKFYYGYVVYAGGSWSFSVVTASGTTLSKGTETVTGENGEVEVGLYNISDNVVMSTILGYAQTITIDGTTIKPDNNKVKFDPKSTTSHGFSRISSDQVLLSYLREGASSTSYDMSAITLTIKNKVITFGEIVTIQTAVGTSVYYALRRSLVKDGDVSYLIYNLASSKEIAIPKLVITGGTDGGVAKATASDTIKGIAKTSGTSAQTVQVYVPN